jgi:predicted transcriptional regulator
MLEGIIREEEKKTYELYREKQSMKAVAEEMDVSISCVSKRLDRVEMKAKRIMINDIEWIEDEHPELIRGVV